MLPAPGPFKNYFMTSGVSGETFVRSPDGAAQSLDSITLIDIPNMAINCPANSRLRFAYNLTLDVSGPVSGAQVQLVLPAIYADAFFWFKAFEQATNSYVNSDGNNITILYPIPSGNVSKYNVTFEGTILNSAGGIIQPQFMQLVTDPANPVSTFFLDCALTQWFF